MKIVITKMGDHLHIGTLHGETSNYYEKDIKGILNAAKLSWSEMIDYIPVEVDLTKKVLEKYHSYVKSYKGMPFSKRETIRI